MLLSYVELVELVKQGVITNVQPGAINGASIDVHLGPVIRLEALPTTIDNQRVDLSVRETIGTYEKYIGGPNPTWIDPGRIFLAATQEMFNLPNDISCQFLLKSTIGRAFLNHMSATWGDATWHSANLTLELKNDTEHHTLGIREGMPIGQIKFYRHTPVPHEHSYAARGRYNGDIGPKGGKL